MGDESFTYVTRLKSCYKFLSKSRVVLRRETDAEALEFFQRFCNDTIPKSEAELQFRDAIRDLYYADKTSFLRCASKNPHLILLTENREIVLHFRIQDIIFIKWDGYQYHIQKNDYPYGAKKWSFTPFKKTLQN